MNLTLYKYESLGNDYFVLDSHQNLKFKPEQALIERLCHRHLGFGADGLLWGPLKEPDVRIYNADGSEAEKSGNGLRIFARFLQDTGRLEDHGTLNTLGGPVRVSLKADEVSVEMGKVSFLSLHASTPRPGALLETLTVDNEPYIVSTASIGNPHCTLFLDKRPTRLQAERIGPKIEHHPAFPNRTNVQWVWAKDPHTAYMEIWERGSGYTLSSGSSASAAVAIGVSLGYLKSPVKVYMPGGCLKVTVDADSSVVQSGSVQFIGTCLYPTTSID